jgi:hypothetical protein
MDAPVLNIEIVADPEIGILTSDANGFVKRAPEVVTSLVRAAQRARAPHKVKSAAIGVGTDAAPFSRVGLKAGALLLYKTPRHLVAFYHQKRDRPELLGKEALLSVLKLCCEWVRNGGE